MLSGENDAAHARIGERAHNSIGIELRGIEDLRIFISVAPFLVGERIDSEMQECRTFELVPRKLARARNGPEGIGRRYGFRGSKHTRYSGEQGASGEHVHATSSDVRGRVWAWELLLRPAPLQPLLPLLLLRPRLRFRRRLPPQDLASPRQPRHHRDSPSSAPR